MLAVARETALVARALNVRMESIGGLDPNLFLAEDPQPARAALNAMAAAGRGGLKQYTGIQSDIMVRRRRTEVDHQPGAVAAKARGLGLSAPYCEEIVPMIKEVEDGRRPLGWENLTELARRVARRAAAR